MKIAVFTNNNSNQKALVCKMSKVISIDSVFVSKNITPKSNKNKKNQFLLKVIRYIFSYPFSTSWKRLNKKYNLVYPAFPNIPKYSIDNINDDEVVKYIRNSKPNIIVVSGTTMVKDVIIDAASKIGCLILNLHTGISPYIRGGPNCTNWCLAENTPNLIGNTIMKLDIGIDSGDIIVTERTNLNGSESLFDLHWKVMEHAHDLYIRSVLSILKHDEVSAVKQNSVALGTLFISKQWGIRKMVKAYVNYLLFYKKNVTNADFTQDIKLFPIDNC